MLQMLLSKNLEKHELYRFLHDILGDGLVSIEGKFVWLAHIIQNINCTCFVKIYQSLENRTGVQS